METDHSPIVHQGLVEIPVVDESTAFRQELHLVDANGQEKLVIHNFFDEPLDVDIASLSADMLKSKAGLDVNVSDELLSQLEEPVESIASEEGQMTFRPSPCEIEWSSQKQPNNKRNTTTPPKYITMCIRALRQTGRQKNMKSSRKIT